jgi:hypothetical protein
MNGAHQEGGHLLARHCELQTQRRPDGADSG